jgi:diguanylate cyclase
VNDTFGHGFGDQLLCEVGARLMGAVRAEDTVARVGGDEFVVLLPRVGCWEEIQLVAEKLRGVLARPYELEGRPLYVTGSVGVAVYPVDGGCPEELLRAADLAMYEAKKAGRDRVAWTSRSSGS